MLEPFITPTVASCNLTLAAAVVAVKVFCIECNNVLILERYYSRAKLYQQPIMELYTASQNKFSRVVNPFGKFQENLNLGKITHYTVASISISV